jgi:hypothetical protein
LPLLPFLGALSTVFLFSQLNAESIIYGLVFAGIGLLIVILKIGKEKIRKTFHNYYKQEEITCFFWFTGFYSDLPLNTRFIIELIRFRIEKKRSPAILDLKNQIRSKYI